MKGTLTTIILAASLAATGCLHKETTSTIYLRTDGSLDWVVFERDVRSDEPDAAKREAEEFDYLNGIALDRHPVAASFRALGGQNVRTQLLRGTRPYAVMIDAGFDSLSRLVDSQLAVCGVNYDISQTAEGGTTTWRLWADVGVDGANLAGQDCGAAFSGVSEALDVTLILLDGKFTEAEGFTLSGSDRATLADDDAFATALKERDGRLVLSLSWVAAR